MTNRNYVFLLFSLALFASCNITKGLEGEQLLITKTSIEFETPEHFPKEKKSKKEFHILIKPQADVGIHLSNKIYQWGEQSKKEKGILKWLQRNAGKAPAIYKTNDQVQNRLRLKKSLRDQGFFRSDIKIDTLLKGQKIELTYKVITEGQYRIGQVYIPGDTSNIGALINASQQESLLQEGDFYSANALANERTRINNLAVENGYIDFDANYIYYFVDTIPKSLNTNIYVKIKSPETTEDYISYRIGKTKIYPNYDLSIEASDADFDTISYLNKLTVIENYHLIDHQVLDRMILQEEGNIISKEYQDASVNHLLELGIFKFVNLKYQRQVDSLGAFIHRSYFLTPTLNQTISANLELNNRTGRFYGIGASMNYKHLNVFKKAMVFNTSISGGIETQIGNNLSFINTTDLNIELGLAAPGFILPFKTKQNSGLFVPRTTLSISNNFQRRTALYTINSSNLNIGYQWKETSEKQHTLIPISINRVEVLNTTVEFDSLLLNNPRLSAGFQNSLIAGLDYTYIYTNQSTELINDYWFIRGNLRTSGNLALLAAQTIGFPENSNGQFQIVNLPFAQFTSIELDIRYYKKLNHRKANQNNNLLAFRFSPAIGFAYGNSTTLPYIEHFFVGGSNSLRAFRIRRIGPGSFVKENIEQQGIATNFIDQTGDVKLEMSAEYRFHILGYFKGAAFVDAGNVWLLRNINSEENNFSFKSFWQEIAIGTGLGLRVDVDYFVLRLDLAVPLYKPYFNEGFSWTFDRINFGNKSWRSKNLIYNLAIGYPF